MRGRWTRAAMPYYTGPTYTSRRASRLQLACYGNGADDDPAPDDAAGAGAGAKPAASSSSCSGSLPPLRHPLLRRRLLRSRLLPLSTPRPRLLLAMLPSCAGGVFRVGRLYIPPLLPFAVYVSTVKRGH